MKPVVHLLFECGRRLAGPFRIFLEPLDKTMESSLSMNRRRPTSWLTLIFLGSSLWLGCDTVITDGEYLGLTIGQTKTEVLESLQTKPNVSIISPQPYESISIDKESINDIDRLMEAEALDFSGPWYNAQLEFNDEVVSTLHLAPFNEGVSFGLTIGQSKKDALLILKIMLRNCQKCSVHNFVPGHLHFSLDKLTSEQRLVLLKYDRWKFSESDEFSHMDLFFRQEKLARMEYWWSPIELP